jgi:hypothetical protein
MTIRQLLMISTVATWATACVTTSLWKATDPEEYVSIQQKEVSESELQKSGLTYRKDDRHGVYYVEKSGLRRLGDYTIRFFATPVTVVLDAAPAIVVIGGLDDLVKNPGGTGSRQDDHGERLPDELMVTPVWYAGTMTPTAIPTPQ